MGEANDRIPADANDEVDARADGFTWLGPLLDQSVPKAPDKSSRKTVSSYVKARQRDDGRLPARHRSASQGGGRPPRRIQTAEENPSSSSDLWTQQLGSELNKVWVEHASQQGARSNTSSGSAQKDRWLWDPVVGLGPLARAILIRDVFKTMRYRDKSHKDLDEHAKVFIPRPATFKEVFGADVLKPLSDDGQFVVNIHDDSPAAQTLRDPAWRERLCNGISRTSCEKDLPGLNGWFGERYRSTLGGGVMTPALLFDTRFFGADAPARYQKFVLTGQYALGANTSLLPDDLVEEAEIHDEERALVLAHIRTGNNYGKPIISVQCQGSPTTATAFAAALAGDLQAEGQSVCYLPLAKHLRKPLLNDAGFESIVEALYRYVQGHADLRLLGAEAADSTSVHHKIDFIRQHLISSSCVLIFDGYCPAHGPFPSLVEFIRDEPLGKLLRLLQHPVMGDVFPPLPPTEFRRTFFVVIGDAHPHWLSMHHLTRLDIQANIKSLKAIARRTSGLELPCGELLDGTWRNQGEPMLEWHISLFDFLLNSLAIQARSAMDANASYGDNLRRLLRMYWEGLPKWQQVTLWALSLSETGLRFSTIYQILHCYGRMSANGRTGTDDLKIPGTGEFDAFIQKTSNAGGAALLVCYRDSEAAEKLDAFDHPSQSISPIGESQVLALSQRTQDAGRTVDFFAPQTRQLVEEFMRPTERRVLHRVMSELRLQAYHIQVRMRPNWTLHDGAARRTLVEALYHGMRSLPESEAEWLKEGSKRQMTIGEIPGAPAEAFSYLYFSIFRDQICKGDFSHISRYFGDGILELELLLFLSKSQDYATSAFARNDPEVFVRVPPWLKRRCRPADAFVMNQVARDHLMAICKSAKRSSQVKVLRTALERLQDFAGDDAVRGALSSRSRLEQAKLKIDDLMLGLDTTGSERKAAKVLMSEAIEYVVRCAVPREESDTALCARVRNIRRIIRQLRHDVQGYVGDCLRPNASTVLVPDELDARIEKAFAALQSQVDITRLPPDAVSILTRLAVLTAHVGDTARLAGQHAEAIKTYFAAICVFWLAKRIATTRVRLNPLCKSTKVSAQTAEELLRITLLVGSLGKEHRLRYDGRLPARLEKSIRRTLDTYTREQSRNLADHIAMPILESAFARATSSVPTLERLETQGIPGDRRLLVVERCLRWLTRAERDMLSITGRPRLRVLFCEERVRCLIEGLDRLQDPIAKNRYRPDTIAIWGSPLLHWLANDLLQLKAFISFMNDYAPEAMGESVVWRASLEELVRQVKKRLAGLQAFSTSKAWVGGLSVVTSALRDMNLTEFRYAN